MPVPDCAASPLTIRLFGPFEVRLGGVPMSRPRTRKAQWLLALLALRAGSEVERTWLAGMLWPDSLEALAFTSFRNSLADLRRALGPEADRLQSPSLRTLSLDLSDAEVDVVTFDAAIAQGDTASLERAVALHRGPLLEGCTEEWAFQERQAREQAYLAALETLAADALTGGDPAASERHLRRVVAVDPLRESAQRALIQALAAGGNYAAALLAYRELRLLLRRELNAEPDPETKALFQRIRAEAQSRAQASPSALSSTPSSPPLRPLPPLLITQGTLTFLFTDIEGSTRLWEQHPEAMGSALARHDALLRHAIERHGGHVFKTVGDQFCAAFATAPDALTAALAAQGALQTEPWEAIGPLWVRMALHTGAAEEREGDYFGPALNGAARLLEAGHGGQILLSAATQELARDHLPEGASLQDLGTHRLKDLQPGRIFQLVHPALPAEFPPLASLDVLAHNLPRQLTSFIGREQEMAEVKQLLATTCLLTLTGAGGCGKTRLALQVATDRLEEYPEGVWWVELAALADPSLVPQTVASALGLRELPGRTLMETLAHSLRPRSLLLVLDNCEHLLSASAHLVDVLLRGCPHLRILATSRERLGIAGELTYRVPCLSLPDLQRRPLGGANRVAALMQSEAAHLFLDRAVFSQPQFALTQENARAVAGLCQRLDGIPLAIELAAAWVKLLSVEEITARLDDRFRLLTGGSRTALPRHQTLRALIDWSYDLLSEPERGLLRRLSVFAGGFTLEAAEAICADDDRRPPTDGDRHGADRGERGGRGTPAHDAERIEAAGAGPAAVGRDDVLDLLAQLVDKSLVLVEQPAAETRYRLLETVRQYSRDRLLDSSEAKVVRDRHRDFFLQLAERAAREVHGPQQVAWLDRLEQEHDNLRVVLDRCLAVEGNARAGLRLVGVLWRFWVARGYFGEGRQWVEGALSRGSEAPAALRAKALIGAGALAYFQGSYASSRSFFEESLALARAGGDRWSVAFSLFGAATVAAEQGDGERATPLAEESLAIAREVRDPWLIAGPLLSLGIVARVRGDYERAASLFDESLDLYRRVGENWFMAIVLVNLGEVRQYQGDYEQARASYKEGLALCQLLADRRGMAWCLQGLGEVAGEQGQPERAARLLGAADHLLEAIDSPRTPQIAGLERHVAAIRVALGGQKFTAAWTEGRAMPLEQAISDALEPPAND